MTDEIPAQDARDVPQPADRGGAQLVDLVGDQADLVLLGPLLGVAAVELADPLLEDGR